MAVLVNAASEELEIRPTHRLLRTVDPVRLRALVQGPDPLFQAVPVAPEELAARLADLRDAEEAVFGLVLPDGEGWLIVGDVDAAADRMRARDDDERAGPSAWTWPSCTPRCWTTGWASRRGPWPPGRRSLYTRSEADAIRGRVARGEARPRSWSVPPDSSELAAVAGAGDVMPQKSTYFYPKLLTGMVFYPLEG